MDTAGGAYTIESALLQGLVKLEKRNDHTFYILYSSESSPIKSVLSENVKLASFRPIRDPAYGTLRMKLVRLAKKLFLPETNKNLHESLLREKLEELQIDVMWWLKPVPVPNLDIPYIYTVWDLQHRLQPWFPEVSANGEWGERERYLSSAIQQAAIIVTGTETGKREIEKFYQINSERIKKIPFPKPDYEGVEEMAAEELRQHYRLPETFLLYPAQYWPHKNHIVILKALAILKQSHDLNISVVFTGSDKGNKSHIDSNKEKLGVGRQVYDLGFVPRPHLLALYKTAEALVFPSYFGPDNLPPLEAFELKCPVIAANVKGAEEQLGDAALLFNPEDPNELASAILRILEDESLRATLVKRGKHRVGNWTVKNYVHEVVNILDEFEQVRTCWGNYQSSYDE